MGLGQFPKWKPFLKSESHVELLALLGWEEKGEGAVELVAMSIFVNRGRPEQSKRSVALCHAVRRPPPHIGTGSRAGDPHCVCLLRIA